MEAKIHSKFLFSSSISIKCKIYSQRELQTALHTNDDHKAFRRQLEDKRPIVESNLLSGRQYIASEPPVSDTSDTEEKQRQQQSSEYTVRNIFSFYVLLRRMVASRNHESQESTSIDSYVVVLPNTNLGLPLPLNEVVITTATQSCVEVVLGNIERVPAHDTDSRYMSAEEQSRELTRSIRREVGKLSEQWNNLIDRSDNWKHRLDEYMTFVSELCVVLSLCYSNSDSNGGLVKALMMREHYDMMITMPIEVLTRHSLRVRPMILRDAYALVSIYLHYVARIVKSSRHLVSPVISPNLYASTITCTHQQKQSQWFCYELCLSVKIL
uniref:Uncharacterized protein n=1 Tax=Glossina austeni TaxID=7395 RepID=A0A1A9V9A1_GLOAU